MKSGRYFEDYPETRMPDEISNLARLLRSKSARTIRLWESSVCAGRSGSAIARLDRHGDKCWSSPAGRVGALPGNARNRLLREGIEFAWVRPMILIHSFWDRPAIRISSRHGAACAYGGCASSTASGWYPWVNSRKRRWSAEFAMPERGGSRHARAMGALEETRAPGGGQL